MIAPQYREVIPEDSLDVEGQQKAPDYTFRVGSLPKFYAEAKKCGVNIGTDPAPAFQLRRYGWSAKLAVSILTDFEELAVYDCTMRPHPNEKASHARIQYLRFEEYPDRWREIWDVFSRESVWSGAFDQYAASKRKRGTSEVDEEFLKEMEGWRLALASNIALRKRKLSLDDLNAAVQLTIDRVVFLRMAEDRGLEPYEQLLKLCERPEIYSRFMHDLSRRADQKYNSGLFHFQEESGVSDEPDRITPSLAVDDKVFKPILQSLYFAHGSPYQFGVMPVEILGTVYERFLGKVIRLTAGHQAKIEEKPEVRKAGGVYYTPAYIVDYIVANTVGRQIAERSPSQLAGKSPFRVLDMACGSGSFLLGASRCLLDHHLNWYVEHKPESFKKAVYKDARDGHWRLTIDEKKRILTTHVFGVDIDRQAVEVTKLSLLLKVLEGETSQSFSLSQFAFGDRALPNLADNIKCGNSLIGSDYFDGNLFTDNEELKRVNPFEWKKAFPAAMTAGGFDCVIGNPPWLMAGYYLPEDLEYLRNRFKCAQGKFDLYYLFVERASTLLSRGSLFGMIVPNKFFHTKAASSLRYLVSEPRWIRKIVDFGDEQIFSGATNYSCILFLQKEAGSAAQYVKAKAGLDVVREFTIPLSAFSTGTWHFEEEATARLFKKMERLGDPLEKIRARFGTGVQSGADGLLTMDRSAAKSLKLEPPVLRPILRGRNVRRYVVSRDFKLLIFPYRIDKGRFVILSDTELQEYKRTYKLLCDNKARLARRVWFGKGAQELSGKWYGMMYLDAHASFAAPHILTPSLSNRSNFAVGTGDLFATGTAGITSIIPRTDIQEHILFLLGLLNSSLINFYAISHSPIFSGGYYKFSGPYLKQLPIRRINFTDASDTKRHDKLVDLVQSALGLHKLLLAARSVVEKAAFERQIDATDSEIDRLVYELYDLTAEEIALVEGQKDTLGSDNQALSK